MRRNHITAIEAILLTLTIRSGLRVMSFDALRRRLTGAWSTRRADVPRDVQDAIAAHVGDAVRRAARRLPGTTCLVDALAAELMLRRRGVPSTLHIGVRAPLAATPLDAHAWLECGGTVVVGGQADVAEYRILTGSS
jgi:hypothetical protein